MSTRANIILFQEFEGSREELIFYRHSDGYPSGTLPTLKILSKWIKDKQVRGNLTQCAGWLIVIGAIEYNTIPKFETEKYSIGTITSESTIINSVEPPKDWEVGAYEPTTGIHGDIEYLYEVNVQTGEIEYKQV